jgi:hypothetical protein
MFKMKMKNIIVLTAALFMCSVAALFLMGTKGCGTILGGNVYSDGYRDGYIVGVSLKRQGFGGLAYVGEVKVSFYGFGGGAVDVSKPGQSSFGSWSANFFDKTIAERCAVIRGDQLVRIHYTEKDIQFNGGTNYEVTKVEVLPPAGELVPVVSAVK